jgi:hypothetical protein
MSKKYHAIISILISVGFVVVVQIFAAPQPVFRYLLGSMAVYLTLVTLYNFFHLRRLNAYSVWTLVRFVLVFVGWFGVYLIIPSEFWRSAFLIAGLPLFYFIERIIGHPGEQLLFNETLLATFTGIMAIVGFSHYFLLPGTLYLLLLFVFVTLVVRSSYELTPQSRRSRWMAAVAYGLAMTEVYWAAGFLPFHYSAIGLLVFNAFYCVWTLGYYYLYNHLTPKKVQFHILLALVFTILIIIITPWRILD